MTNSCKVVYVSDRVGAQSAGAHGYVSVSFTVPSGFKTSGIYSLSVGHPGQASTAGFSVIGSVARGVTGTNTAYVSYSVPYGNLSDSASDFGLYIHCVPSSWDIG